MSLRTLRGAERGHGTQASYAPHGWPQNHSGSEARRHAGPLYAHLLPPCPTEAQFQLAALHRQQPAQPAQPASAAPAPVPSPAPPADIAALLAAWRPGLPLPAGLPPMPAGWRPGDPLPGAPVAPGREEAAAYVPRVALVDLNPDLEGEGVEEVVGEGMAESESEEDWE